MKKFISILISFTTIISTMPILPKISAVVLLLERHDITNERLFVKSSG